MACLMSSAKCRDEEELRAWMAGVLAHLEKVPPQFRQMPLQAAQKEFGQQVAKLKAKASGAAAAASAAEMAAPPAPAAFGPVLVPALVRDCHNEAQLLQWRERELKKVFSTVPRNMRHIAIGLLEKDFQHRLGQLRPPAPTAEVFSGPIPAWAKQQQQPPPRGPPACLLSASACGTPRELHAWRATKLMWIRDNVPDAHKREEVEMVQKDYAMRLGELEAKAEEEHPQAPGSLAEVSATREEAPRATTARLAEAVGFVLVGLLVPAFLSLASGTLSGALGGEKEGRHPPTPQYIHLEDA